MQDRAAECSVLCAQPQKTCESARVCEVSLGQGEHSFHHPLSGMLQRGKNWGMARQLAGPQAPKGLLMLKSGLRAEVSLALGWCNTTMSFFKLMVPWQIWGASPFGKVPSLTPCLYNIWKPMSIPYMLPIAGFFTVAHLSNWPNKIPPSEGMESIRPPTGDIKDIKNIQKY